MATKKKTGPGLSEAIDKQEDLQDQIDEFKQTFLDECKQLETSNVDLFNRISDRMGL